MIMKTIRVPYTTEQRKLIVELRHQHLHVSMTEIMHKYNSDPIAMTHPMEQARDVNRILTRYNETCGFENRPKAAKPKTATDENHAVAILAAFQSNPHVSTRQVARDVGVSQFAVMKVKKDHKYRSYKPRIHQKLLPLDQPKRKAFCDLMVRFLNEGAPDAAKNIVFTDEAAVFLDGVFNRQTYRYCSDTNPHWVLPVKSQSSPKVNVWVGLFGCEIIGPFYFPENLNGMLDKEILPAIIATAMRQRIDMDDVIYQQDEAPAHFAKVVQNWLNTNFPVSWIGRGGPFRWPPRSPDLAPCDLFAFPTMKNEILRNPKPETVQELKDRIDEFFYNIGPDVLKNVRDGFVSRLKKCQEVGGQHFEHLR